MSTWTYPTWDVFWPWACFGLLPLEVPPPMHCWSWWEMWDLWNYVASNVHVHISAACRAKEAQKHSALGWPNKMASLVVEHRTDDGTRVISSPMKFKVSVTWTHIIHGFVFKEKCHVVFHLKDHYELNPVMATHARWMANFASMVFRAMWSSMPLTPWPMRPLHIFSFGRFILRETLGSTV
jgi:hypothetical protein